MQGHRGTEQLTAHKSIRKSTVLILNEMVMALLYYKTTKLKARKLDPLFIFSGHTFDADVLCLIYE